MIKNAAGRLAKARVYFFVTPPRFTVRNCQYIAHPLSAVRDGLFSIFTDTLNQMPHSGGAVG